MTQYELVAKYIKDFGKITTWEAFKDLGITRLSAKIYILKKRGYKFKTKWIYKFNRYGKLVKFKEYSLDEEIKESFLQKILKIRL